MTAQYMLYSVGAKQEQHSQCLLGPFAFREFPAENCLAWKAERGADKHQTTSTSCISRAHGRFCLGAWRHSLCGWAGLRGYTNITLVLKKAAMSKWGTASGAPELSVYLTFLDGEKCSFTAQQGGRGVDSGLLCVSKVVSTLEATNHLSASL